MNLLKLAKNEMKSINGGEWSMECRGTTWDCTDSSDWHATVIIGIRGVIPKPETPSL